MGAARQGRGKRAAHEQQSGKRGPAGLKRLRERREMAGRRLRLANAREVLPASMRAGGVPRRFAESDRQSARHTRKPAPAATSAALRYAGRRELSEGTLRFTKGRRAQVPIAPCDTRAESARYFAEDSPIPRQHNSPLLHSKAPPHGAKRGALIPASATSGGGIAFVDAPSLSYYPTSAKTSAAPRYVKRRGQFAPVNRYTAAPPSACG